MSQTFPPPTLRFVGSDVNTVCSSAPVPEGAIWERGVLRSKKVPIKLLNMTHCISAGANHVGKTLAYFIGTSFQVTKGYFGILYILLLLSFILSYSCTGLMKA